jgi:hypothetical protein
VLTASFFWSLSGLLLAAGSVIFLLKDLKNGRIYTIVGVGWFRERGVVIKREQSPLLFKLIVRGVTICTAITFVICLIVLVVSAATSTALLEVIDFWQAVVAIVPYSLVLMYVFDNISVRVFARWYE